LFKILWENPLILPFHRIKHSKEESKQDNCRRGDGFVLLVWNEYVKAIADYVRAGNCSTELKTGKKESDMVMLKKVTLQYIEIEDRIRMLADLDGEEPAVFWLTQRLCRRLVPKLAGHLEHSAQKSLMVDKGLMLSVQQHDAGWQQKFSEPVKIGELSRSVLPETVNLLCPAGGASIIFPLDVGGKSARLQMTMLELRQWMGVIYRQFQVAGWPMEVWPHWFALTEPGKN
jgi:hypothetical protein